LDAKITPPGFLKGKEKSKEKGKEKKMEVVFAN